MDTTITDLEILPLDNPKFLKPFLMRFKQNGIKRSWECAKAMNSVSTLLYHTQKDAFLFVKQFRPAVWLAQQDEGLKFNESGYTYELCAGLKDKGLSDERTAYEEVIEECGYAPKHIERITTTYGGFGFSGHMQTMFYASIDESMRVGEGGGVDDESIELIFVPRQSMQKFIFDESKPKGFGLLFAYYWWNDKFSPID
ncbi:MULTISPECIES: NUDIX hydrolase [unclassified Campylobacter]|uniref:NUDIX hydrolase n=1 Tax=unclassified Campylobacter TaxID=2593542 RepID=UPI003D34BC43